MFQSFHNFFHITNCPHLLRYFLQHSISQPNQLSISWKYLYLSYIFFFTLFLLSQIFFSIHSIKTMFILPKVQFKCGVFHRNLLITWGSINGFFFPPYFHSNDHISVYHFILHCYLQVYHLPSNSEVHLETLF